MRRTGMTLLFSVALLAMPTIAQDEPAQAKQPEKLPPILKEFDTVRAMLSSAERKFERGIAGVQPQGTQQRQLTPVEACCASNLEHVDAALENIRQLARERGVCFERRRDREGVEVVNLVLQDIRGLEFAVDTLLTTESSFEVERAFANSTRTYLNLKRSLEALDTPKSAKDCAGNP